MQANDAMRILGSAAAMGLLGGGGALAYNATTKPILDKYGNVIESNDINPVMAALGSAAIGAVGGGIYGKMNQPVARPVQGTSVGTSSQPRQSPDIAEPEVMQAQKIPKQDAEYPYETYWEQSRPDERTPGDPWDNIANAVDEVTDPEKVAQRNAQYEAEFAKKQQAAYQESKQNRALQQERIKRQQAATDFMEAQGYNTEYGEYRGLVRNEFGELVKPKKPFNHDNYGVEGWDYLETNLVLPPTQGMPIQESVAQVEKTFVPRLTPLTPEQEALYAEAYKLGLSPYELEEKGWKYNPNQPTIQVVPASPMQMQNPMAPPGMRTVVVQPMKEPGQEMMEEALMLKELARRQAHFKGFDYPHNPEPWNYNQSSYSPSPSLHLVDGNPYDPNPEAFTSRKSLASQWNVYGPNSSQQAMESEEWLRRNYENYLAQKKKTVADMTERTFVGGNYRNRESLNKLPQWAIDAQNRPYTPPSEPPGNRLIGGNFEGRGGQKLPAWAINNARNVESEIEAIQNDVTQQAINSRNYDSQFGNDAQEYGDILTVRDSDIPFNDYQDDIHQLMTGYYHRY